MENAPHGKAPGDGSAASPAGARMGRKRARDLVQAAGRCCSRKRPNAHVFPSGGARVAMLRPLQGRGARTPPCARPAPAPAPRALIPLTFGPR